MDTAVMVMQLAGRIAAGLILVGMLWITWRNWRRKER